MFDLDLMHFLLGCLREHDNFLDVGVNTGVLYPVPDVDQADFT